MDPTWSTGGTAATVDLPVRGRPLTGGAGELVEGPPPGPIVSAVLAFVQEVAFSPGFQREPHPRPEGSPRVPGRVIATAAFWAALGLMVLLGYLLGRWDRGSADGCPLRLGRPSPSVAQGAPWPVPGRYLYSTLIVSDSGVLLAFSPMQGALAVTSTVPLTVPDLSRTKLSPFSSVKVTEESSLPRDSG